MIRKRFLLGGLLISLAGLFLAASLTGAAPLPWRSDSPAAEARTAALSGGFYNPLPEPPGSHALSALPDLVNFQGLLTDPGTGNPVPDATYSVRFSIWSLASGGTEEWAETQNVTTVGGLFSVALGDGTCVTGCPLSDVTFDGSERWLEVKVGADPAMTPRLPFLSVPYAFHAETADSANSADFATDADTVDGAHAAALEESGEIDSDIAAHTGNTSAHHIKTVDTFVTNRDAHDHLGGDGAQILHSSLGGVTTNQHHTKTTSASEITSGTMSPLRIAGTAWTSLNDGSGSGLDADTVDGAHASALEESAEINADIAAHSAIATAHHTDSGGTVTSVSTGTGLIGGPITSSGTISHADTSSAASVNNAGGTVVQDVTLDGFGHLTALGSTNLDSRYVNESQAFGGDVTGTFNATVVGNDSHSHTNGTVSDFISINNSRLYAPAGAGNVGIGTTNPLATLTVNDNIPNQFPAVPGITIGNPGGNAFIAMGADGNRDISMAWLDSSGFGEVRADGGPLVLQRFSGNVGIGTPSTDLPDTKLEVNGGSTYVSDFDDGIIFNTDLDNTPGHHFVIKGTAFSPDESLGFYHWNTATPSDNPAGSLIFRVDWQGDTYGNTFNTVGLDVAESYADFEPGLEAGDVVALDSTSGERLVRATSPYQSNLLGIVSDDPGVLLGGSGGELDEAEGMPLALSGKVPVRVILEGGTIGPGDYLTSSSTPGFAMKATEPGATIGIALEAFDGSEGEEGKVLSFVSLAERNSAQAVREMQAEIEALEGQLGQMETRLSALEGNQDGPSASAQADSRGSDGTGGLPLLLIVLTLAGLAFAVPAVAVTRRVIRGTWL